MGKFGGEAAAAADVVFHAAAVWHATKTDLPSGDREEAPRRRGGCQAESNGSAALAEGCLTRRPCRLTSPPLGEVSFSEAAYLAAFVFIGLSAHLVRPLNLSGVGEREREGAKSKSSSAAHVGVD